MSVANLADSITPSILRAHPLRHTARDKECMARVMYFESNRSSRAGMVAVGTVVMNRLRSGKHGDSVCAVVGERNQFAPGVLTRSMDSKGATLAKETAEAVLKGERSRKLKNAMFFHTAGLKFPYKNMHYVLVAGGNSFYEKRTRNWKPLPPEPMIAFSGSTPEEAVQKPAVMVASAVPAADDDALPGVTQLPDTAPVPATAKKAARVPAAKPVAVASAKTVPLPHNSPFALASADQAEKPIRKKLIVDPETAPLPTARASMVKAPARKKAAEPAEAAIVQVAAEEPLAARFGRFDDGSSVSLGFTQ